MNDKADTIRSRIWEEEPEPDNPFAAKVCYCGGYDVYGELLVKASWAEYLLLLFGGDRPEPWRALLLERLAVAVANPGPRDLSVRAAMNGGVGGAHSAASLMAALGVGAGQYRGGRDVYHAVNLWDANQHDIEAWRVSLNAPRSPGRIDAWPELEHPPGFDPHGVGCSTPVKQSLALFAEYSEGGALSWLASQREVLESFADHPLSMEGVAAAAFVDLGMDCDQAEMLYLILRLPGAAVHSLEQRGYGWQRYPFWLDGVELSDDPGPFENPESRGERL